MKKRSVFKILVLMVLMIVVSAPAYSQRSRDRIWFGFPASISYQFPLTESGVVTAQEYSDYIRRTDFNFGVQVFFPVGNGLSLGPEIGFSYPFLAAVPEFTDTSVTYLTNTVHIPIRLVLNIPFGKWVSLDALVGTEVNIWETPRFIITNLSFDVGARLDVFGLLIEVFYALPFTVDALGVDDVFPGRTQWKNAITVGAGYRFKF